MSRCFAISRLSLQLNVDNVEISQTDDWRGDCVAVSVTSIRLGCIYWLGSVSF